MELVPTASPDDMDVNGAWVLTDRWAPVSKYRLAASLAGALFLACVPAAALLHWPHQMKTDLEAETVQAGINQEEAGVISPSSASQLHEQDPPLRQLVPVVPGYTKLGSEAAHTAWTIHLVNVPSKCLTVNGDNGGAALHFEPCDFSSPEHQQFILPPPNSDGEIKWFKNPELCLENPVGVYLQMWKCSTSQKEKRMFRVSPDGSNVLTDFGSAAPAQHHSRIHLAAQPGKCLDIPHGSSGARAQLWDCYEHKENTAVQPNTATLYQGPGSASFRVTYV